MAESSSRSREGGFPCCHLLMLWATRAVAQASVWRGSCFNAMLVVVLGAESSKLQRAAAGVGKEASLAVISRYSELEGWWLERVYGVVAS